MNINVSIASVSFAVFGGGGVAGIAVRAKAASLVLDDGTVLRRGACCRG